MLRRCLTFAQFPSPAVASVASLFVPPEHPTAYVPKLQQLRQHPRSVTLEALLHAPYCPESIVDVLADVASCGVVFSEHDRVLALQRSRGADVDAVWSTLGEGSGPAATRAYFQKTRDPIQSVKTLLALTELDPASVTPEYFASTIAACTKSDAPFTTAAQVLQWMPFTATASVLSSFALTVGSGQELKYVIQMVEATEGLVVTDELIATLLFACSRAEDYPQRLDVATNLYRRARDDLLLPPTVGMLDALMLTAASLGDVTRQHAFFVEAQSLFGQKALTPISYASSVRALATAGFVKDATESLHVILHNKIDVTVETCNIILRHCENDVATIQRVMSEMRGAGLLTSTYGKSTVIALLRAYRTLKRTSRPLEHAMELVPHMPPTDSAVLLQLSHIFELHGRSKMAADEREWMERITECVMGRVGVSHTPWPDDGTIFNRAVILSHSSLLQDPDDILFGCENLFPRHDVVVVPFSVLAALARGGRGVRFQTAQRALRHILRLAPCAVVMSLEDQVKLKDSSSRSLVNGFDVIGVVAGTAVAAAARSTTKRASILSTQKKMEKVVKAAGLPCDVI